MSQIVLNTNSKITVRTDTPTDISQQGRVEVDREKMTKIFQILDAGIKKEKKLVGLLSNQVEILNTRNTAMGRSLELIKQSEKDKIDEITRLNSEAQEAARQINQLSTSANNLGLKLNVEQTAHATTKENAVKREALLTEKVRLEKLLGELNTLVLKGKAGSSGSGGLTGLVTGFFIGGPIGAVAGLAIGAGAGFGGAKLVEEKLKQSDLIWIQNRLPQIDQELQALNGK